MTLLGLALQVIDGIDGIATMNPFCRCCCRFLQGIPVAFILSVVAWSYYAFVVELCFNLIYHIPAKIFYLSIYHVIIGLFLWAYYATAMTNPAQPPSQFKLDSSELRRLEEEESEDVQHQVLQSTAKRLPVTNRTMAGNVRYCERCRAVKPDRCHHCSVCGTCILKMDHHCPWVNNCVAFSTYKFFLLFLFYALVYCLFVASIALPHFIRFWTQDLPDGPRFHVLFLFFVAVMFAISLSILFSYHCFLVLVNRTTLEAFRPPIFRQGPDKSGYNIGKKRNFQEIFGEDPRLWAFPVFTSRGDGVKFPLRKYRDEEERLGLLRHHRNSSWQNSNGGSRDGGALQPSENEMESDGELL